MAKQESDKALAEEKDGHQKTQEDLALKQIHLAEKQINDNEQMPAIRVLEAVPPNLRNWEWQHLLLAAQGSPEMLRVFPGDGGFVEMMAFTNDSRNLHAAYWRAPLKIWDLVTGAAELGPKTDFPKLDYPQYPFERVYSGDASKLAWVKLPRPPENLNASIEERGLKVAMGESFRAPTVREGDHLVGHFLALQAPKKKDLQPKDEKKAIEVHMFEGRSAKKLNSFEIPAPPWGKVDSPPQGEGAPFVAAPRPAVTGYWTEMVLNQDGSHLAVIASDWYQPARAMKVFDTKTGQEVTSITGRFDRHNMSSGSSNEGEGRLVFSPDGQYLARTATGSMPDGQGTVIKEVLYPVSQKVLEKLADGKTVEKTVTETHVKKIAVTIGDNAPVVKVWEVKSGKEILSKRIAGGVWYRLTESPDSKRLFFGNSQGAVAWDIPDGQETFKFQSYPGPVLALAFSPDGKRIATGRGEMSGCGEGCKEPAPVTIWAAATGRHLLSLNGPIQGMAWALLWSPDGRHLAANAVGNPNIIVWSALEGRLIYPFDGHRAPVTSVTFSPDGKFLASFSECNQRGMVLDGQTGKKLAALDAGRAFGHGYGAHGGYGAYGEGFGGGGCLGLTFTPDSRFLSRVIATAGAACAGAAGGSPTLWDRATGKLVTPSKKVGTILAYSPDGKRFVAMPPLPDSKEPIVLDKLPFAKMFEGEDKELFELKDLRESGGVAFSPDGKWVTSFSGEQRPVTKRFVRYVEEEIKEGKEISKIKKPVWEEKQEMDWTRLPDGRPYFIMKLVQGSSLRTLLHQRRSPADDLPRFLAIFEQICQTLAYAHSQGVIHRDLKPANVMVGEFGEVQVLDWGLAKQIADIRLPIADLQDSNTEAHDENLQSKFPNLQSTQAGQVMGTPAYMAPEQARGEVEDLDATCDVFGLGGILCEMLTGQPPFASQNASDSYRLAMAGDLSGAFARLDGCGADAELVALARKCLAPGKDDRPETAGAVAEAVANYQVALQRRLKQAEIDKAAGSGPARNANGGGSGGPWLLACWCCSWAASERCCGTLTIRPCKSGKSFPERPKPPVSCP